MKNFKFIEHRNFFASSIQVFQWKTNISLEARIYSKPFKIPLGTIPPPITIVQQQMYF